MRVAISSQNFRSVTGHAGKARRFICFDVLPDSQVREVGRLDLPIEMAMHGFDDRRAHPLDGTDILITGGAGDGFVQRMARRGVRVLVTGETDPETAIHAFLSGHLKPPAAADQSGCGGGHHHDHDAIPGNR